MEIDGAEKQTKQSDRSSNDSDLKVEIRTASSLSNIPEHDSEHWDEGSDAMKNESIYRYSDYIDPVFPPKHVRKSCPFSGKESHKSTSIILICLVFAVSGRT